MYVGSGVSDQGRLCTTYQGATQSAAALEHQIVIRQQPNKITSTVERHASSHEHVAVAQAMQIAVKYGVSEGKQHVNTVARYTAEACAAGVTVLLHFDIKPDFQKKKRHADS